MKEQQVSNNGVTINYLCCGDFNSHLTPIIIVPGLEAAEDYIELMQTLLPRPSITISLRGRGKSIQPKEGYMLYDHIQDIETVIEDMEIQRYIMFGYSFGVSYMLGYALGNLEKMVGMIIGDFPAVHRKLPKEWLQQFNQKTVSIDRPKQQNKSFHKFLNALQRESHEVVFWEVLQSFHFPVLVVSKGELSKQEIRKYEWYLPNCHSLVLKNGSKGHLRGNQDFIKSMGSFCSSLDL
ncbi:alpha/beta hydrolase [Aquibacillus halophilus]|uniref:Alpha/beta hydrolase n=1 Tax=Aquibacillus halophilus TaxID=930132 RepID=A0A6A8D9C4_9BACI|nr:alpha/beta hydrolase [Aquibacillus halophilus]MRH41860.1 alpha/beta hydrolase [Aquibacillus halophilus]